MKQPLKHQWSIGNNYLMGITFGAWCKLLMQNSFRISPAYLHRAAAITTASLANSAFAGFETWRFDTAIEKVQITNPPLFILGHWRSGTTHLHELLAQDTAQFQYANTYQVVNPLTYLTTEGLFTRLFAGFLPTKRAMDNMALSFTSPQEDEFGPLLMSLTSSYLSMSFPDRVAHYDSFLSFKDANRIEVEAWKAAFIKFCKKLSLTDPRALLMKSPPHTARIKTILELFPDARFVHIHRDPYRVFQSQQHFFDTLGWYAYLQRPDLEAVDQIILQRHEDMYDAYFEDLPLVAKDRIHEIRFSDLEASPISEISKTYSALSLDGFADFEPKLRAYLASIEGYEKNTYPELDPATKGIVARRWSRSFERWGY